MKARKKDDIVEEVRKIRETLARKEAKNPGKFHRDAMKRAEKLGFKRSTLKPMKIDFSKLHKKKPDTNNEAA